VTYIRPLDMSAANVYCSPNVADVLGYTAAEWETDPGLLARIVHPDDVGHVLSEAAHVRSTGAPFRGEYRYVHRDGHIVWVQDETYLIRDEDGAPYGVQGYLLDITERKLAEAERDRLQSALQHAQKLEAIGQLAGGVAHEFNNTLTAIRGYATLVHEQLEDGSPLRRDVCQILGSAERAASLPRQLLAFGRKQVLNPRPIDLTAVTETTVELLRPLLDPAIVLATSLDPEIPPTRADPTQVEQVIVNLVLNASDAIAGHGTIDVTTRLTEVDAAQAAHHAVAAGTYIALGVSDTGCGMDEETRARIFEPFFTTKEEGKGTGLGLSTAYGLVRQGGGFLTVESLPGRGTTMTMHLPLRPAAAPTPLVEPARGDGAERQGIAVVVDDERAVRTVCAALLTRLGFETREARDAEEALALLEELDAVAVLLTDVVMPGSDGLELARKVAKRRPGTAVVTMSAYADRAGATRGVFLQKPFTMQELEERVDEALALASPDRRRPRRTKQVAGG
jgi:PAS domain S-box-containing protein